MPRTPFISSRSRLDDTNQIKYKVYRFNRSEF